MLPFNFFCVNFFKSCLISNLIILSLLLKVCNSRRWDLAAYGASFGILLRSQVTKDAGACMTFGQYFWRTLNGDFWQFRLPEPIEKHRVDIISMYVEKGGATNVKRSRFSQRIWNIAFFLVIWCFLYVWIFDELVSVFGNMEDDLRS